MIVCWRCGMVNSSRADTCRDCGADLHLRDEPAATEEALPSAGATPIEPPDEARAADGGQPDLSGVAPPGAGPAWYAARRRLAAEREAQLHESRSRPGDELEMDAGEQASGTQLPALETGKEDALPDPIPPDPIPPDPIPPVPVPPRPEPLARAEPLPRATPIPPASLQGSTGSAGQLPTGPTVTEQIPSLRRVAPRRTREPAGSALPLLAAALIFATGAALLLAALQLGRPATGGGTPSPTRVAAVASASPIATPSAAPTPSASASAVIFVTPNPTASASSPPAIASGQVEIRLDFRADLDEGVETTGPNGDVRLRTDLLGQFVAPAGGALMASVGLEEPGFAGCSAAPLSDAQLRLDDLQKDSYICVTTSQGNISQLQVTKRRPVFQIEFTTWASGS